MSRQRLGEFGEKVARIFLEKNGYQILVTNFRTRVGEIDIIAFENEVLVFVEVKTRKNKDFLAAEAISQKKQITIAKVAEIFIAENNFENIAVRFDAVLIDGEKLELLKDAFMV